MCMQSGQTIFVPCSKPINVHIYDSGVVRYVRQVMC